MPIPSPTDGLVERLDALFDSIEATFTGHACTRSLQSFGTYTDAQLEQGVLTLVSAGERDYSEGLGMAALDGTQDVRLVGHLKVAEDTEPAAIEELELALMEGIKTWVRAGIAGFELRLERLDQSAQLEHPYGWVVARLTLAPPRSGVY